MLPKYSGTAAIFIHPFLFFAPVRRREKGKSVSKDMILKDTFAFMGALYASSEKAVNDFLAFLQILFRMVENPPVLWYNIREFQ